MRILLIVLLGFLIGASGNSAFRKKTLNLFNDMREMIAVGTITRITTFLKLLGIRFAPIGPASNMFRLAWSRELEQVAFENSKGSLFGYADKDGYALFSWQGDILDFIRTIIRVLPFDFIGKVGDTLKSVLEGIIDVIEAIITVVWLASSYPAKFPITKEEAGKLGPANGFYAERTHIGCFNHLLYSVCALKKVPADRDELFKIGVACSECPEGSRCEIKEYNDGEWYEEGDLCTPFQNEKPTAVKAARTADDYDDEEVKTSGVGENANFWIVIAVLIRFLNF